mgnify:CR=1 FL=1
MAETEQPQIYLLTPPEIALPGFADDLARVVDAHPVACIRLTLATADEDRLSRAADACREVAHVRDIALVIDRHVMLAARLGLDGVHLPDGARGVRHARKALGPDAIIGAFCGASKHDGLNAGEAGADYVAFGPVGATALGDGTTAPRELFEWWSEMIEVPVVAEGGAGPEVVASLAPVTDFLAVGEEVWRSDDPAAELGRLIAAMG